MFPKLNVLLITSIIFSAHFTLARNTLLAEPGTYKLIEGESQLCQSFSLSEKDLISRSVSLGSLYSYETKNALYAIESDIDPTCEFKEVNQRLDSSGQTVLTRTNEEFCRGKLRSRTVSTASLTGTKIVIAHQIDRAQEYKCVFIKE